MGLTGSVRTSHFGSASQCDGHGRCFDCPEPYDSPASFGKCVCDCDNGFHSASTGGGCTAVRELDTKTKSPPPLKSSGDVPGAPLLTLIAHHFTLVIFANCSAVATNVRTGKIYMRLAPTYIHVLTSSVQLTDHRRRFGEQTRAIAESLQSGLRQSPERLEPMHQRFACVTRSRAHGCTIRVRYTGCWRQIEYP